jgi:thymidylate synthase ThyX
MIEAKVIEHSVPANGGKELITLQLKYPRLVHSEFMTHRVFSRNASSSRAIPVSKMIASVREEPAMPVSFGKNKPGMQSTENFVGEELELVKAIWLAAANDAAKHAEALMGLNAHKQVANRLLEPFQWIHVVVSSTEWSNFFELRDHPDADPTIGALAHAMRVACLASKPQELKPGEWHLPYVTEEERLSIDVNLARCVSAARTCRVSYLKHDGTTASIAEELALCRRLVGSRPLHASPFEHQATPDSKFFGIWWKNRSMHGNFDGWQQHRKIIEQTFNS